MTVRVFRNSDSSAPALSTGSAGVAGELTALLDAVLVTGYPTQGIESITRTGSTATVTITAHGYSNGNIVSISGADEDEYNGNQTVANVAADTFDFTVAGSPATPAVSSLMLASNGTTALGWKLAFTGVNLRAYQSRVGNQHYLRVDHNSWAHTGALRGYETMSDVSTGTGPFPTVAQHTNGLGISVANSGGAGEKPWTVIGDESSFHINIFSGGPASATPKTAHFGELTKYLPSDPYSTCIIGSINPQTGTLNGQEFGIVKTNIFGAAATGMYMARSYTGILGAVAVMMITEQTRADMTTSGLCTPGGSCLTYPAPLDGGLHIQRFMIAESDSGLRGLFRGAWFLCHERTQIATFGIIDGVQFEGSSGIVGRTFEMAIAYYSGSFGMVVWEISDSWEAI